MENPYRIELVLEKDVFTEMELPYYYVYDQNGNFIERFFYGDRTIPGFGETGWIYTDNNAYNFLQIKNTVLNSFDPIAKEKFNKVVSIMNETGLPYHLALTLYEPDKKEVEVIDTPISFPDEVPELKKPLINPLPEPEETPVFALPLPPEEEEIIFTPIDQPSELPEYELPLINVYPDPKENNIPYEETERMPETPNVPGEPIPIPDMPYKPVPNEPIPIPDMPLISPDKDFITENKNIIIGLGILLLIGLMSE